MPGVTLAWAGAPLRRLRAGRRGLCDHRRDPSGGAARALVALRPRGTGQHPRRCDRLRHAGGGGVGPGLFRQRVGDPDRRDPHQRRHPAPEGDPGRVDAHPERRALGAPRHPDRRHAGGRRGHVDVGARGVRDGLRHRAGRVWRSSSVATGSAVGARPRGGRAADACGVHGACCRPLERRASLWHEPEEARSRKRAQAHAAQAAQGRGPKTVYRRRPKHVRPTEAES